MISKTSKTILFASILSIVIIGGMNATYAEKTDKTQYTNIRGDTVFLTADTASGLYDRGYLVESKITETSYDLEERWTSKSIMGNAAPGVTEIVPWFEFDLPKYITVGEPFEINIPYTFVKFDTDDGTIPIEQAEVDEIIESYPDMLYGYIGTEFILVYREPLVLLNPEAVDETSKGFNYDWQKYGYSIQKEIHYDIEKPHNIKLEFLLNGTVGYPIHDLFFRMGHSSHGIYFINDLGNGTYEISETKVLPNWGPGGEPQPCTNCPRPGSEFTQSEPFPTITKQQEMIETAKAIREFGNEWWNFDDSGYENLEESLRDEFGNEWTNEFLKLYPEFVGKFILSLLDWNIPEAHAQSSFIVRGSVEVEEKPRRYDEPNVPLQVS